MDYKAKTSSLASHIDSDWLDSVKEKRDVKANIEQANQSHLMYLSETAGFRFVL